MLDKSIMIYTQIIKEIILIQLSENLVIVIGILEINLKMPMRNITKP